MAIPDYESVMLPLLEFAATSDAEHSFQSGVEAIVACFGLTEADRELLLPSGRQSVIANRVGWARTYLKKAGLLEDPRRG